MKEDVADMGDSIGSFSQTTYEGIDFRQEIGLTDLSNNWTIVRAVSTDTLLHGLHREDVLRVKKDTSPTMACLLYSLSEKHNRSQSRIAAHVYVFAQCVIKVMDQIDIAHPHVPLESFSQRLPKQISVGLTRCLHVGV